MSESMSSSRRRFLKVSAATAILRFGREGLELDDLAARIEVLEQAAELSKDRNGPRRGW